MLRSNRERRFGLSMDRMDRVVIWEGFGQTAKPLGRRMIVQSGGMIARLEFTAAREEFEDFDGRKMLSQQSSTPVVPDSGLASCFFVKLIIAKGLKRRRWYTLIARSG